MNRFAATVGLLLALVAVASTRAGPVEQSAAQTKTQEQEQSLAVQVVSSEELRQFLREHPDAERLERHALRTLGVPGTNVAGAPRNEIRYSLGRRLRGDRRVARKQHNNSWPEPNDIQLELVYPDGGVGVPITYVQVDVDQSNGRGEAYVVSGGIGQRHLKLLVEATNTYRFNYDASIYGHEQEGGK